MSEKKTVRPSGYYCIEVYPVDMASNNKPVEAAGKDPADGS
ncbi:hypothetical protein T01_14974 [Trichinella spiralis]|uniref:Uncharacterized protein n=1 Tax=Trichinella spiralis TaxID=6334 RepID=A0A0V1BS75_TRISP|nr:hypothetical protein T01_14974 [Trichinella spiralis]